MLKEPVRSPIVDIHVHLAALPDGDNGCFISQKMLRGPLFKYLSWKLGLPVEDPVKCNEVYVTILVKSLETSRFVKQAVILALDGVYGPDGMIDRGRTEFLISNRYVLETVARYPKYLKAGVSINPQRRDAVEELERCVTQGAALVKVLPNTQIFDPANKTYQVFYRALAKYQIPLLSHVGYEFSLWGQDQSVGDPARMRLALEQGVTVIAAHGASYGLFLYEKYWDTFMELARTFPNFYWDASALSLPNRVGMLLRLQKHPELQSRMVFGTDYPLPSFAYPALLMGQGTKYLELLKIKNPFDRHYLLLETMGFPVRSTSLLRFEATEASKRRAG